VTKDYIDTDRSLTYPSMGAYEYPVGPINIEVTATSGFVGPTNYSTVKQAFDKINDGTHQGKVTVKILGNTTETATASLNSNGSGSAMYTAVNIYPTVSGLSITGNLDAPLIDLNGADHVTIDGRVNATGSDKDLVISNTSNADIDGTSTIRFINDASNDTVNFCKIKGSAISPQSGIVFISTGILSGNDNNLIDQNDITSAADAYRPLNAVYAYGSGDAGIENSTNTIRNNELFDFFNQGNASGSHTVTRGVSLAYGNTDWAITGNSFYETTDYVSVGFVEAFAIQVDNETGNHFTVSGNYIGGSGAECIGTWKNTGGNFRFKGITTQVGSVQPTSVQGNRIRNFDLTSSARYPWTGMDFLRGKANTGTEEGNFIGDTTGTGSITIHSSNIYPEIYAVRIKTDDSVAFTNNMIGSIECKSASGTLLLVAGILVDGGTVLVRNNKVGSMTSANNIYLNSPDATDDQLTGIYCRQSADGFIP
jgi:hypothetical protein